MRAPLWRRLAVLAGGGLLTFALTPPAAQAAPADGAVAGVVTGSDGTPAVGVWVQVYQYESLDYVDSVQADDAGAYRLGGLPAGSYRVAFDTFGSPTQYAHRKTEIFDADEVVVASGGTATVNEMLLATGVIRGRVVDSAGQPAADVPVQASSGDGGGGGATTDSEGRYEFRVFPGAYTLQFDLGSWQDPVPPISQYHPGKVSREQAVPVVVAGGQELTVDEALLPVGSLSGRLLRRGGAVEPNATVELLAAESETAVYVQTDAAGRFTVPRAFAGSYKVHFADAEWNHQQHYRGKLSYAEGDAVVVRGGENTVVDDAWVATGSVKITAKDAKTGAPVAAFCAHVDGALGSWGACGGGGNGATITDVPPGTYRALVYTDDGSHLDAEAEGVRVTGDAVTPLAVSMKQAARISIAVVDRGTGKPLSDVCVDAVPDGRTQPADGGGECTDAQGKATIGRIPGGAYRLFAVRRVDARYGAQWVGGSGGTGDRQQAALVTAPAGAVTAAPQVRMDGAGSIAGRVTEQGGSAPMDSTVSLFSYHPGAGSSFGVDTDADGRYTLSGLGPYEWPLFLVPNGGVRTWSGGVFDRRQATRVKVTAGGTATYNPAVRRTASGVGGAVRGGSGAALSGWVVAYNTTTGDAVGAGWADGGAYDLKLLGGQSVFISYALSDGERSYDGYYVGPTGRGGTRPQKVTIVGPPASRPDGIRGPAPLPTKPTATAVTVPASGTLTIDLVVGAA